ncbi:hybrid sensor histidine kinase/response regulator [Tautonia marina]|uniref:hybrid sensor histidine kinase/response regulator n=1 Tax=Tautonia marina TaxID=2653855 RepID=UPI001260B18B|nr:response regulator [Tautonia marina]
MRHANMVPRYAIALLSVTLAFVLRWVIDPLADQEFGPFLFFAGAVTVSAWYGGLLPGLMALGLSVVASIVAFLPPVGTFWLSGPGSITLVLAFVLEGLIICMVCQMLHQARARAELSTAEAREALRARRTSETRFRRLAESGVIGVIEGRDEMIVEANDAFLRMLDYPRDRLANRGLSVAEITPEDEREHDVPRFAQLFRTGTLPPFEKRYMTSDGQAVPVLVGGALIDPGGLDWAAFVLDLSRQKIVERELAQAIARAEAANRAKSEFLAVLSHELITPMNAILGMNQLAMTGQRDPILRDYLATAQDSAEALLALLSDLLDYSSIEVGGLDLDPAPFQLRAMLDRVIRPLADRASRKGLELTAEVADAVPEVLVGDARRLRQILVNLLDNAIKFTEQGDVTLTVGLDQRDDPGAAPDEVSVWFEVADTGIGISAEDQGRIFAPFTQIDASTTRPYSGTGLGLSICRQIVTLMGGELHLESQSGQGSRFRALIPFRNAVEDEPRPSTSLPDLSGLPVLVVDDRPASRSAAESILAGWSMRPVPASDGSTALALLAEAVNRGEPFPLVLVDARMPGLDGVTVASRIHREGLAGATILMQSPADRSSDSIAEARIPEVEAVLEKPITPARLLDAIVKALEPGPRTHEAEKGERGPSPAPPRSTPERSLHILLAEDTPANQKLALAVLRRRGHRVDLAANGREAVELARRSRYDLILMDLQMPVMDGLQATCAIRALNGSNTANVPIVALTAHTLPADRQRCLQAGMDHYLAKPIDIRELLNVIESYGFRSNGRSGQNTLPERTLASSGNGPRPDTVANLNAHTDTQIAGSTDAKPSVAEPAQEEQVHHDQTPVYDRQAAVKRLGGDEELFRDMIGFFLEDFPGLLDQLCQGLLSDDARAVERAAHSLKGLTASCGSGPARQAAGRVEQIGRDNRLVDAPEAVEHLVAELQRLRDVLKADRDSTAGEA